MEEHFLELEPLDGARLGVGAGAVGCDLDLEIALRVLVNLEEVDLT